MDESSPGGGPSRLAFAGAWILIGCAAAGLLAGFFVHTSTLGAHDWDYAESQRYFVAKSIRAFGQFPFWNPYACGGFPAWGATEGDTVVVSPFLPAYLWLPLPFALRVEIAALVMLLVVGLWFFASPYVKHPLALAFVCIVGGLNSRMALQVAVGHAWHLYYAGMPWVLGAFDRAIDDRRRHASGFAGAWSKPEAAAWSRPEAGLVVVRLGWVASGAAFLAMMIYGGGIYPVPHTVLCLIGLGAYRARAQRTLMPLAVGAGMVGWAALLAAPKLLAIVETMERFPRRIQSLESLLPIQMFLSSSESFNSRIPEVPYLWHEYGQYVGILPLVVVFWAGLRRPPADPRILSLRFVGWTFMVLALGFLGPWGLLHLLPPFKSQHVPTRFTYPAFFLLSVVAAQALEEKALTWRERFGPRVTALALWTAMGLSAVLIARENMKSTLPWFSLSVPDVPESTGPFVQYADIPAEYNYGDGNSESPRGTNSVPGLLAHRANVGTIRCSTFPGLNQDAPRALDGRPIHLGARGLGDPLYAGAAWVEPRGQVDVVRWTPSEVTLDVHGAQPGDLVALDENWDQGWTANGLPAVDHQDVVATHLDAEDEIVVFRYRPRTLPASFAALAFGLALVPSAWFLRQKGNQLRSTKSA